MDKNYLSTQIAEALGWEQGVVEAEHRLMNDGTLEFGMKRQLQEIHSEDQRHVSTLQKVLDVVGRTGETESKIEQGREMADQIVRLSGDDALGLLKGTILAKYRSSDSAEMLYDLCDEMGETDICDMFEQTLEEDQDQLDYLREQAILMSRERIAGQPAAR